MGTSTATLRTLPLLLAPRLLRSLPPCFFLSSCPLSRDYNDYVMRNLSRGYSRKDLGLSLLKEKRIKAGVCVWW